MFVNRWITALLFVLAPSSFAANDTLAPHERQIVSSERGRVVLEFWDDDLIHVEITPSSAAETRAPVWTSPMIKKEDYAGPRELSSEGHTYRTAEQKIAVDPKTLCVSVTNRETGYRLGRVCPENLDQPWKSLTFKRHETTHVYGLGQSFRNPGTADGDLMGYDWDPGPRGHGNKLRSFHGGANGFTTFPMAYFLGRENHAYGFLYDNVYKQRWNLSHEPWRVSSFGDRLRFFVLSGPNVRDIRRDYMDLVGRPPVPPASTFGLWVSEFGFEGWDEVFRELEHMEERRFPVDGFGLDIQWFGGRFYPRGADTRGSRMGTLRFDNSTFGDPEQTVHHLRRARGVELMPIEEPYVSKFLKTMGFSVYDEMAERGFLARNCPYGAPVYLDSNPWWGVGGMVDFTNPDASAFWHRDRREHLTRLGLRHHWTDLGEPEMYSKKACYHGFPDLGKHRHGDIHNVYNLKWAEGIARGYKTRRQQHAHPSDPTDPLNARPFVMSRSGTIGLHRHSGGMWSGDIAANLGALTAHYNAHMHMSMVGIDYYNSDVGGFHRRPDVLDGDPGELYTQWLANAALFDIPIRSHVWNLSNQLETSPAKIGHFKSNRFNIRQRYRLFPYYYSLAHQAYREGRPVIPPLFYHFPKDPNVRKIGSQKMIGPWLMGAMVAGYGQTERRVYLPAGRWINFHTDAVYDEDTGRTIPSVPTWQDGRFRLPLFARAGAIIPMRTIHDDTRNIQGRRSDGTYEKDLRVRIYPAPEATSFRLYEDDGNSIFYKKGDVAVTRIEQHQQGGNIQVTVHPTEGTYAGEPSTRSLTLRIAHYEPRGNPAVNLTGEGDLPRCGASDAERCWELDSQKNWVEIRLPAWAGNEKRVFRVHHP